MPVSVFSDKSTSPRLITPSPKKTAPTFPARAGTKPGETPRGTPLIMARSAGNRGRKPARAGVIPISSQPKLKARPFTLPSRALLAFPDLRGLADLGGLGSQFYSSGMTPNCCIMPIWSKISQCSTDLPPSKRSMAMPVRVTCLFVGGMPLSSPWCVPCADQRTTTRSGRWHC